MRAEHATRSPMRCLFGRTPLRGKSTAPIGSRGRPPRRAPGQIVRPEPLRAAAWSDPLQQRAPTNGAAASMSFRAAPPRRGVAAGVVRLLGRWPYSVFQPPGPMIALLPQPSRGSGCDRAGGPETRTRARGERCRRVPSELSDSSPTPGDLAVVPRCVDATDRWVAPKALWPARSGHAGVAELRPRAGMAEAVRQ
jgi:hypothetical protein